MKEHTRDEAVDKLTNGNFDVIEWEDIAMMIEHGFKGYANFTNQELIEEWEFLFEESIKITD